MSKKVILFQGDSVTDCGRSREECNPNAHLGDGYPALAAARLLADHPADDYQCFNRGVSGNRIVDLYARWKIDALNLRPDVLSILIGVNDTWHEFGWQNGVEVPRYRDFYRMLLDWTKRELPKIRIVLCEPFILPFGAVGPGWAEEMAARSAVVRDLADEYHLHFVPMQQILTEAAKRAPQEKLLVDGVHPTLQGHQLLADAWLRTTADLF